MTFDEAKQAFEDEPSPVTIAQLLRVAREYEADGRIGDDTFQNVLATVQEYLDAAAILS